jgi:photosystem II stability/assembly factor-like uncharacterized protein
MKASISLFVLGILFPIALHSQWNWEHPMPQGNSINSIKIVNDSYGWAVGDFGTLLKYNGAAWSKINSPTTQVLRSLFMINQSSGWAVGDSGVILYYNGVEWELTSPVTNERLNAIAFSGNGS